MTYAPASGRSVLIKAISLTNRTSSDVNAHIRVRAGSSNQELYFAASPIKVPASGRVDFSEELTLSYVNTIGDKLEIWAETANAVDLLISGIEREIMLNQTFPGLALRLLFAAKLGTTANSALYAPAQGKSAVLKSIILVNTSASAIVVNIGVTNGFGSGGFALLFGGPSQQLPGYSRTLIEDKITLAWQSSSGDRLEAWASMDQSVHCLVSGIERDGL